MATSTTTSRHAAQIDERRGVKAAERRLRLAHDDIPNDVYTGALADTRTIVGANVTTNVGTVSDGVNNVKNDLGTNGSGENGSAGSWGYRATQRDTQQEQRQQCQQQ